MSRKWFVDEDGLSRLDRRQRLLAYGWQPVGRASASGAWRFRHRDGRQLVVPCRTEVDASRALLRQLQGETDAPTPTE
jgi:hypothetical protein